MSKKNFKGSPALNFITPNTYEKQEEQEVYDVYKKYEEQEVYDAYKSHEGQEVHDTYKNHEEQEEHRIKISENHDIETGGTQGKKGKKLPRLNMAFYNNNLEYVQRIAGVMGVSITAYINQLIDNDKNKNMELYEKIKNLSMQMHE